AQRIVGRFIREGLLDRHLIGFRRELRARRDALVQALRTWCPSLTFDVPSGGYSVWASLPDGVCARDVIAAAARHDVALCPGDVFMPGSRDETALRFCFAGLAIPHIFEGTRRLGAVLHR